MLALLAFGCRDAERASPLEPARAASESECVRCFRQEGQAAVTHADGYRAQAERGRFTVSAMEPRRGPEPTFETVSFRRQGSPDAHDGAAARSQRVNDSGAVQVDRGTFTERLEPTCAGIMQSWHMTDEPAGDGDLIVRVATTGLAYVSSGDEGLLFASAHGSYTRYGHATWIDASGSRVAVPSRYAEGAIELRVPSRIVEQAAYPAVLDPLVSPTVGPEVELSSPGSTGGLTRAASETATNAAGTTLVIWSEYNDIYGARIAADGTLLDTTEFRITPTFDHLYWRGATVASDGTDFLVTWSTIRHSRTYDIYAARVSGSGAPAPTFVPLVTSSAEQDSPVVAFDGTYYAVAWLEHNTGSEEVRLLARRFTSDGAPVGDAIRVHTKRDDDNASILYPDIAAGSGTVLVSWSQYGIVDNQYVSRSTAQLYDAAGKLLRGMGGLDEPTMFCFSRVAYNGSAYLRVWNSPEGIRAQRVTTSGTIGSTFLVNASTSVPWLVASSSDFLVLWTEGAAQRGARVSSAGALRDPTGLTMSVPITGAAPSGAGYLALWSATPPERPALHAVKLAPDATVISGSDVVISAATGSNQRAPVIASNGKVSLAVWEDDSHDASDVVAMLLDEDGSPVGDEPLRLGPTEGVQELPAVSSDGDDFLVAWLSRASTSSYPDVLTATVSATGEVSAALHLTSGDRAERHPALGFDGTNYFAVWSEADWNLGEFRLLGARIDRHGVPIDAGLTLPTPILGDYTSPSIAYGDSHYLVAWIENGVRVNALRVGSSGGVIDAAPIAVTLDAPPPSHLPERASPVVAYDGDNFLVAWEDRRNGAPDIYGTRVTLDGELLDPGGRPISAAPANQHSPRLFHDGVTLIALWSDGRNFSLDAYGTRIQDGNVLDLTGFPISDGPLSEATPAGAKLSNGRSIVVYQKQTPEGRIQARIIEQPCPEEICPPPVSEPDPEEPGTKPDPATDTDDSTGAAGAGGSGGEDEAGSADPSESTGCGCRTTVGGPASPGISGALLLGLLLARRLRRRPASLA